MIINKKEFLYIGYRNLNKVFVSRVIPMAEETIIASRMSFARTVRSHQWHVTKRGHTIEKEFREGVGFDMTEGMVTTTTFNTSHQTSWLHLCGEDS